MQRLHDALKAVNAPREEITRREEPRDTEHECEKRAALRAEYCGKKRQNDRVAEKEEQDVARLVVACQQVHQLSRTLPHTAPAPADKADAPALPRKAAVLNNPHERQRKLQRERERRRQKRDRRHQQERHFARTVRDFLHERDIQAARKSQNAPEQQDVPLDRQTVERCEVHLLVLRAASGDEQKIHEQQQRRRRQRENDINRMRERIPLCAPYFLILRRLLGGDAHPDDRAERISSRPDVVFISRLIVKAVVNRLIVKWHIVPRNIALRRVVRPGNQVKRRVLRRAVAEFGVRNHLSVHDAVVAARKIPGLLLELLSGYVSLQSRLQRYRRVVHLPGHVARLREIRFKLINHAVPAEIGQDVLSNEHRRREAPHNARKRDEFCCRTA